MTDGFFKFPSTPHLALLGSVEVRGDKVFSEAERNEFLRHDLIIEEKVDGANLGISFDSSGDIRAQNRGDYLHLPMPGQWNKLSDWLSLKTDMLFEQLSDRYILFGEWCFARHSVVYDQLPDWFLGFDIYDKETRRFLSCARRDAVFQAIGITPVPKLRCGKFTFSELNESLSQSVLSENPAEGLYLRYDQGDFLVGRAKLVRSAFIQSMEEHWIRFGIKANQLRSNSSCL